MSIFRFTFLLTCLAVFAPGARAQRDLKDIPDPDPELERRSFQVAEGFEVNLFAADPLLAKPIQMNWGPDGRLWVVSSQTYPQIKPGEKPDDKVLVLEDRDGDGKSDRTTVFADGLLIPTGIAPGDGGAYVASGTELLHFSDPDESGKARKKRVLLSGFGTEDTHHLIHTLRWGHDGMLYFNQSIYIHSHVETPWGVRRLGGGGIWQYRPESQKLEVFLRGWYNAWGHHFDRWGQSFVTDGAGGEGVNYGIPGAYYASAEGAKRVFPGLNPGSPKYCGAEIVTGQHLPESWQGNLITNDFRGHRVCRFVLVPDGAGYAAKQQADLVRTNHAAFRPVDVKMGPDGAIYLADWYNPIIQHGEVPFRDPRRDRTHGRIWRITAKGRPLVKRPALVKADDAQLLDALQSSEGWTREQARRVLKERGKSILPAVNRWLASLDANHPDVETHRLEGLWLYQSLDIVNEDLLRSLLQARDPRVRSAAVRVLAAWHDRIRQRMALLDPRIEDDHPQVRLEAVRALGAIGDVHAAESALRVLDRPLDPFLEYGLWLTMQETRVHWLPALQAGTFQFGDLDKLVHAIGTVEAGEVVPAVKKLMTSGKLDRKAEATMLLVLARVGGPGELSMVLERTLDPERFALPARASLLQAMESTARTRGVHPDRGRERIAELLQNEDAAIRSIAIRLVGLWKQESLRPRVAQLLHDKDTDMSLKQAAIDGLVSLGGQASTTALSAIVQDDRIPASLRQAALVGLVSVDLPTAADNAVEVLSLTPDGAGTEAIFAAFLQQKRGPAVLAQQLKRAQLHADLAKMGVRTVRTAGRPLPELVDALRQAGGLAAMTKLTPEEKAKLIADVAKGDARRGEAVYRRGDLVCQKCHALGGAGGQVGPDLSSIGASAQVDYLVDSLLEPTKAIKENYHTVIVETRDGQVHTGVRIRQNDRELVLRTAEDREISVARGNVDEVTPGPSLMPEGLAGELTRAEMVDLVRFLSELGKVGPFSIDKAPVVRRWQVLTAAPESYRYLSRQGFIGATHDNPTLLWTSAYSTVDGSLPLADLPRLEIRKPISREIIPMGFVRFHLEAKSACRARLRLADAAGLRMWLDQTPIDAIDVTPLDLQPGMHAITLAVSLAERKAPLRIELVDEPGKAGQVRLVGGK